MLLTELTELTDMARPRLTPPILDPPSLASPLPLRLPEAMLLVEECGPAVGNCDGVDPGRVALAPHVVGESDD